MVSINSRRLSMSTVTHTPYICTQQGEQQEHVTIHQIHREPDRVDVCDVFSYCRPFVASVCSCFMYTYASRFSQVLRNA